MPNTFEKCNIQLEVKPLLPEIVSKFNDKTIRVVIGVDIGTSATNVFCWLSGSGFLQNLVGDQNKGLPSNVRINNKNSKGSNKVSILNGSSGKNAVFQWKKAYGAENEEDIKKITFPHKIKWSEKENTAIIIVNEEEVKVTDIMEGFLEELAIKFKPNMKWQPQNVLMVFSYPTTWKSLTVNAFKTSVSKKMKEGLQISNIKFVEESTAASFYTKLPGDNGKWVKMIIDMGKGTLDITIIEGTHVNNIETQNWKVLCSKGNEKCAGSDFSLQLLKFIHDKLCQENLITYHDTLNQSTIVESLKKGNFDTHQVLQFVEEIKENFDITKESCTLCVFNNQESEKYNINFLDKIDDDEQKVCEIEMNTQELINNYWSQLKMELQQTINEAIRESSCSKINSVMLIGGGCKLSFVKWIVEEMKISRIEKYDHDERNIVCHGMINYALIDLLFPKNIQQKLKHSIFMKTYPNGMQRCVLDKSSDILGEKRIFQITNIKNGSLRIVIDQSLDDGNTKNIKDFQLESNLISEQYSYFICFMIEKQDEVYKLCFLIYIQSEEGSSLLIKRNEIDLE